MNSLFFIKNLAKNLFERDEYLNKLIKNGSILLSGNLGASALALVATGITTRALGVENYGFLTLITTYSLVMDRLVNFQSSQVLIKYGAEALEEKAHEKLKKLLKFGFFLDFATSICATLIAISLLQLVAEAKGWNSEIIKLTAIYCITILFHLSGTPVAILRIFDKFKFFAYITLLSALMKLIGVGIAYYLEAKFEVFLLVWGGIEILENLLLIIISLKVLSRQGYLDFFRAPLANVSETFLGIWGFAWSINVQSSIRMVSREADVLILGTLVSPASVGLFKIAKQVGGILLKVSDPLYHAIYPELVKLKARNEMSSLFALVMKSSLGIGLIAFLGWVLTLLFGRWALQVAFGSDFSAAYGVLVWYMAAIVVAVMAFSLQPLSLSLGRHFESFKIQILSTVLYLVMLFPLVQIFGLNGAGISYLAYYIVWTALMILSIKKVLVIPSSNKLS